MTNYKATHFVLTSKMQQASWLTEESNPDTVKMAFDFG